MARRDLLLSLVILAGAAGSAAAHPHIFIDTRFDLVIEEGQLVAVRIDWTYDEFYTLLMIEESDLDADGDGVPEQDRLDAFAGQDVDWEAGFPGDFSVTRDGAEVTLDRPTDHAASFEGDRITTSHTRRLAEPLALAGADIVARSYDPTYFVAYEVPGEPGVIGRDDCQLTRTEADTDAAQQEYGDRLAAIDMGEDPFEVIEIPDIGVLFADSFRLTCDAPS
ncbi:DUF1007 family protein [Pseudoroseicyclus aestuarii]|uniref:ABC-type uncharacterized transport system substrate-binding protein n=1 Tax=Pseudoroseicyclus aestuarii TaxID=1795041 RepID=A0A318SP92_9RHOB|nr:DUF1007 family protein [Pseudoroseicyclus aestuarii]PYE82466.1 ABC-type uncharacterized transport system substrate-binding protein [Pseudoroseicyclus aestuarii]